VPKLIAHGSRRRHCDDGKLLRIASISCKKYIRHVQYGHHVTRVNGGSVAVIWLVASSVMESFTTLNKMQWVVVILEHLDHAFPLSRVLCIC